MRQVITLGLVLILASCQGQADKSSIYGRWTGTKRTLRNGETGEKLTFDGKPYRNDEVLEFKADGTMFNVVDNMTVDFKVNGDVLLLGDMIFKIEKLTDAELVIVEYDADDPNNETAFRSYYKRTK